MTHTTKFACINTETGYTGLNAVEFLSLECQTNIVHPLKSICDLFVFLILFLLGQRSVSVANLKYISQRIEQLMRTFG
jgi:hypothetical protein